MTTKNKSGLKPFAWIVAISAIVSTISAADVSGAMLDKPACATLTQELAGFKALDIDKLMEKGPDWAMSHLSVGDVSIIRRFIEVDEQVKFRCLPPSSLVKLQGPTEDDEASAAKPNAEIAVGDDVAKKADETAVGPEKEITSAKPKAAKPQKAATPKPKPTQPVKAALDSSPKPTPNQ